MSHFPLPLRSVVGAGFLLLTPRTSRVFSEPGLGIKIRAVERAVLILSVPFEAACRSRHALARRQRESLRSNIC
jgi:hypothetical protein